MTPELDAKLCHDYPAIFRDRHAPASRTAMCWGFDCGDGWYPLIDELCRTLTHPLRQAEENYARAQEGYNDVLDGRATDDWAINLFTADEVERCRQKVETVLHLIPVAVQVKEKFGQLRFYVTNASKEEMAIIEFAENMSGRICEACGNTNGTKTYTTDWHVTRCLSCAISEGRVE